MLPETRRAVRRMDVGEAAEDADRFAQGVTVDRAGPIVDEDAGACARSSLCRVGKEPYAVEPESRMDTDGRKLGA